MLKSSVPPCQHFFFREGCGEARDLSGENHANGCAQQRGRCWRASRQADLTCATLPRGEDMELVRAAHHLGEVERGRGPRYFVHTYMRGVTSLGGHLSRYLGTLQQQPGQDLAGL